MSARQGFALSKQITTSKSVHEKISLIPEIIKTCSAAIGLYQQGSAYYQQWQGRGGYTIKISSEDLIYRDVHAWLLKQMPEHRQRDLSAVTIRRMGDVELDEDCYAPPSGRTQIKTSVRYMYDGRESTDVSIDGQLVRIFVDRQSPEELSEKKFSVIESHIVFTMRSLAARRAVMGMLDRIARDQSIQEEPRVFLPAGWGGWARTESFVARDPSTVVLAEGQMERLDDDLKQFLESESTYARIGMPWHRGYLLEGPAGTGKTSAFRALAYANRMDLYLLPLSDVESDTGLMKLIAAIGNRSILLIEDVDIAHAAASRTGSKKKSAPDGKLSLQGLLNALDGAITPHGLITAMTTNHPEVLDDALIRSGRCDLIERVDYLTDEQLGRLVTVITGISGPLPSLGDRQISAATIAEIVKRNIKDMQMARREIVKLLAQESTSEERAA